MATYYVDGAVGSDGNAGTSAGAGNAWATFAHAVSTAVAGDLVYIKSSAMYTRTSSVTFSNSGSTGSGYIRFEGYGTTPGTQDGQPTITTATDSTTLFLLTADYISLVNLKLTNTATTRASGIYNFTSGGSNLLVSNCVLDGFSTAINEYAVFTNLIVENTTIKNCTSDAVVIGNGSVYSFDGVLFTGNAASNILLTFNSDTLLVDRTIFNGGTYGINYNYNGGFQAVELQARECSFYNQSSDAIRVAEATYAARMVIRNNAFWGQGGKAINMVSTVTAFNDGRASLRCNAYASGGLTNLSAGMGDVTLTGNPFTNAGSGDFTLNNTAGAGAACRAAGYPQYTDIGALQHQDAGGTSGPVGGSFVVGQSIRRAGTF